MIQLDLAAEELQHLTEGVQKRLTDLELFVRGEETFAPVQQPIEGATQEILL